MGNIKNAPDVPDPVETAGFQTGTNIGTTLANQAIGNVSTKTPYGTTTFKERKNKFDFKYEDPYTGETYRIPTFKEKVKLSPKEKEQFKLQQQTETNLLGLANKQSAFLGDYLSKPFSLGEFDYGADLGVGAYKPGGVGVSPYTPGTSLDSEVYRGDPLKLGNEATEARLFELGSKRLDPRFAREKETLQSSLMARGIREGTPAWAAAMGQFGEGQNDAYNDLLLGGRAQAAAETQAEWDAGLKGQGQTFAQLVGSRGLGMAEQGQQFGQALATGQFGMAEQAQQFGQTQADRDRILRERGMETGEAFALRSQPINEIAALLGGGQVTVPQLTGQQQPQAPITDVAGLINNNWEQQFKAWQAESQASQGLMGGLFGGVSNIIASDRRIKDDIEQVGETAEGLPIYEFRIGDGEMQAGVMAQDVEKVNPEAVVETPEGIKGVDYGMAVGAGDGTYTVEKGDNLWNIGERFNVPVEEIVAANQIANPDYILPGQVLQIPGMAAPDPAAAIPLGEPASPMYGGDAVASVAAALSPTSYDPLDSMAVGPDGMGAAPFDPLGSMTAGPDGMTAPAAPQPQLTADQIDTLTQTDAGGNYVNQPPGGVGAVVEALGTPTPFEEYMQQFVQDRGSIPGEVVTAPADPRMAQQTPPMQQRSGLAPGLMSQPVAQPSLQEEWEALQRKHAAEKEAYERSRAAPPESYTPRTPVPVPYNPLDSVAARPDGMRARPPFSPEMAEQAMRASADQTARLPAGLNTADFPSDIPEGSGPLKDWGPAVFARETIFGPGSVFGTSEPTEGQSPATLSFDAMREQPPPPQAVAAPWPQQPQPAPMMPPPAAKAKTPVGTVETGSTGGEFFTPPPPTPADPLARRVSEVFSLPQQAVIMDLLKAFQAQMPMAGMAQSPAFGLGGF